MSDDLPAPLSPMTARTSPGNSSKSAWSSAVTRPNRLTNPRASRMAALLLDVERSLGDLSDPLVETDGNENQRTDREVLASTDRRQQG